MSFEYLLLIHIPLVSTAAILPLAGYPLVYLPIHVVWLELVIHPSALLTFQASATSGSDSASSSKIFSTGELFAISLAGLAVTSVLVWAFFGDVESEPKPRTGASDGDGHSEFMECWSRVVSHTI